MTDKQMFKAVFIGSKQLGLDVLNTISELAPDSIGAVVTFDDSADSRSVLNGFRAFCDGNGYPIHILEQQSHLKACLQELEFDLCIVTGWYLMLRKELLDMAPQGFLGFHASMLPAYRGNAPLVWALINGAKRTGVSFFYFEEGMDTGDLVAQRRIDIAGDDTIKELLAKASSAIASILNDTYLALLSGEAPRSTQSDEGLSYCSARMPADGLIDWSQPAEAVYNFIRAQTRPYPCAYSVIQGRKILFKTVRVFQHPFYGVPGVVSMVERQVLVSCSEGAVVVEELIVDDNVETDVKTFLPYATRAG